MPATLNPPKKKTGPSLSSTRRNLNRLRELAGKAGENIYERCQLATALLDDHDWIAAEHGGSQSKAMDWLEEDFFADLSGSFPLGRLLQIFRHFPNIAQWKKRKFHLRDLLADMLEEQNNEPGAKERRERRTVTLREYEQLSNEKNDLEFALKRAKTTIEAHEKRIASLEKENRILREKVAFLEGKLKAFEASR